MEPEILYEDKEVLVINKPAGLIVHGDGKTKPARNATPASTASHTNAGWHNVAGGEKTLVDWVLAKYPKIKEVGEPGRSANGEIIYRPGVVHRLDRETTGAMIIAKTQKSFENLKAQFKDHLIIKKYEAFVYGEIKKDNGSIDRPIGRSAKDFRMWSAQRGARGEMREAITNYKVISRGNGYSLLEVMPKTGRTHQIRVHFKAISYPLVGDSLYAPNRENSLGLKRLALHSKSVTFTDLKGKSHEVVAPYPEDFKEAIKLLSQ
ncbi:RluA family pseudouridine synthase [Patescibacteria group bacterium]|nr:RluA family pseudouridine synthase [Patescibacteria group bacterium]